MAPSPFSLILHHLSRAPSLRYRHLLSPVAKHFSFSPHNPSETPKPSSLSARLSIVFDQIDQIEKERAEKDDALQRIRTWRESRKSKQSEADVSAEGSSVEAQELGLVSTLPASVDSAVDLDKEGGRELKKKEFELVHPWPEWIEFMERLVQHNYFDHRRKDEDKMIEGLGLDASDVVEEGLDFLKDWKSVQTAGLNFGRDRFDIFRSLTRQDIQMLVGYGCPSSDRKAVFSSKLLRKYVHLDEGDVCSSCSLRSTCDKAYLVTNKEDEARTMDVVRVLLTYGFEPINGSVVNKDLLKKKSTKMAIRKLLHEVVKLSSVPIDPNLPPPIIKKRPPKVKQPPPPPRRRIGRDDIEMKKGDWLCAKCDFMNFAKNAICLQCDAKRPKRQLLPGEWECPQCNFLNYRRNMACFHCEHKRPPDEYTESEVQDRRRGPFARPERVVNRQEVSNAWNFDFDDDESDGADVAAFENADAPGTHENNRSDMKAESAQTRRPGDDAYPMDRNPRIQSHGQRTHGTGFDDFEDEEDDDIDNYELEDASRSQREQTSSVNFSDIEDSLSEDDDVDFSKNHKTNSRSRNKSPSHRRGALTGSDDDALDFGSEDDLPIHPKWKSSHVAERVRVPRGRSRAGFDSEEDVDLPSGSDNDDAMDRGFRSRAGSRDSRGVGLQSRTNDRGFSRENFRDQRQAGRLDRQPRHRPDEYDNRSDDGNHFRNNGRGGRGSRGGGYDRENSRDQRQAGRLDRQPRHRPDEYDNRSDDGNHFRNNGRGGRGSRGGGYDRENSRDQRQAGRLDRQPRHRPDEYDNRSDDGNHFRNNGRGGRGSRGGGYGRENSRDQRQAGPLDRQPRHHLNEHNDRSDSGTRFGNNGRGGRGGFGRQRGQFRESNNWSDNERHFEEERPRRPRVNVR